MKTEVPEIIKNDRYLAKKYWRDLQFRSYIDQVVREMALREKNDE